LAFRVWRELLLSVSKGLHGANRIYDDANWRRRWFAFEISLDMLESKVSKAPCWY
jgi:hypothetical protein